jgi:hypothetical protein
MGSYLQDLAIDSSQLVHCHLSGADRVFNREYDILQNLDELTNEW